MPPLTVATIQMNATPTPLDDRLARAEKLVMEAVKDGAKLVLLPELFNVGYSYTDANYDAIESPKGKTFLWMKTQASQHKIYLAGAIMVREGNEAYNRAFLISPQGQVWQYDKTYPFGWERAFFRGNKDQSITVADTEFGKIGMLICWDSAHADLWAKYAGKVNLMLIPSCPPRMEKPTLTFPDGDIIQLHADDNHFADTDIQDQTAWLGVPMLHSAGTGHFDSIMPRATLSVMGLLARLPRVLIKHIRHANKAVIGADFGDHSKIVDAQGNKVISVGKAGEDGYAIATIEVSSILPMPTTPQPKMKTSPFTFFIVDKVNAPLMRGKYRRALNRLS
ncbi:MAG TPA: carbon-nitrogen hydrolase family protein [Aggregatilineales bacterium]|nr:carbon-nitrogen hydrolase family protein [Aggregatilineales bacterium]